MHEIVFKKTLAEGVTLMRVHAPEIARKRKAGQFVVVIPREEGERIPLTIADSDEETITIVFQTVGMSTAYMETLEVGQSFTAVVGPLGTPTHVEKVGRVACVGGGIGVAVVLPIARAMKEAGNHVVSIIGARSEDLLILEDEVRAASSELLISTDDGTKGHHGFVTDVLKSVIEEGKAAGEKIDLCVAIGPVPMMRATVKTTEPYGLKTLVSLNPIMIDGTGMCGGCRVTVGGKVKFVCVDGPEFDGHGVDFDELTQRLGAYKDFEGAALEKYREERKDHECTPADQPLCVQWAVEELHGYICGL